MKKLALAASFLALSAAGAAAADLEARPYARGPMIAAVYDWSGFYFGANGGYGNSRNCLNDSVTTAGTFGAEGCQNATGGVAGVQFGYRTQRDAWVFGFEAQGDWARLRGSRVSDTFFLATPGDITNRTRIDAFGLLTGQVGYAWANALFYVKGGAAVTSARYNDVITGSGVVAGTATETPIGGAVGAGLEFGLFPNLSLGIVYDHLFMGSKTVTFSSIGTGPGVTALSGTTVATDRIRQNVDLITVRINYTFGPPSIAKY